MTEADKAFIERTTGAIGYLATPPGPADDLMPSHLTDTMTDEEFQRRREHKYADRRISRQLWAEQHRALNRR